MGGGRRTRRGLARTPTVRIRAIAYASAAFLAASIGGIVDAKGGAESGAPWGPWWGDASACLSGTRSLHIDIQLCGLALRGAEAARAGKPSVASLYVARARARLGLGDLTRAHADLDHALALNPLSADGWRVRAEALRRQNALEHSLEAVDRAHALSPFDAPILRELGYARLIQGDARGALEALRQSLERNLVDPQTWVLRGLTRYLIGRPALALADFARAEELALAYDYLPVWRHLALVQSVRSDRETSSHSGRPAGTVAPSREAAPTIGLANGPPVARSPNAMTSSTPTSWPSPLLAALTAELALPDLSAAALAQTISELRPERHPEVFFYIGEARLQAGDETNARSLFARAACAPITTAEKFLSQWRLRELADPTNRQGNPTCT